jgi:predicted transcriptional regulator
VAQNLNLNANVDDEPQMSIEEVDQKLTGMFERMGIPRAVATPAGLRMDLDAVQARVNQLLEKRRQKALPAPAMAPGSEIVQ